MTLDYLRTRRQFGKIIGTFQALQHRAAEPEDADRADPRQRRGRGGHAGCRRHRRCAPRRRLPRQGAGGRGRLLVQRECIQLHGGIGYTDEYDVGLYLRKAMVMANQYRQRHAAPPPLHGHQPGGRGMTASDGRSAATAPHVSREELDRTQASAREVSVTRLIEERDGAVLILTIDQPARRNAFAMPIRTAMISALEQAQSRQSASAPWSSPARAGISAPAATSPAWTSRVALAGRERMRLSHQLIRLMVMGSLPVVAAIEGFCVGAGLSLACASDTVVASEDARFAAGFGKIGLMADLGLPHTLPMRVGQGRARQILFYHGQMSAPEAERIGIVDQVVPKGHALATALEKAKFLAEQAPAPMALTKQMLGEGPGPGAGAGAPLPVRRCS